jgi:hypothetical protein
LHTRYIYAFDCMLPMSMALVNSALFHSNRGRA